MSRHREVQSTLITAAMVASVALTVVLVWYLSVYVYQLPKILLPTPDRVVAAAWGSRAGLASGTLVTGLTALTSLICAVGIGVSVAIFFSQSRLLKRAFFPYVIFFQTVPIVAIAPLLIIWSGYTIRTSVIATIIVCIFPIINNVATGLISASRQHDELFALYGASRWKRLTRLQMPTAVKSLVV
ncbi:MAG: ABC transporter permease subunit, partial [Planctomycetota bacterium]